jgi:hypothetical protein
MVDEIKERQKSIGRKYGKDDWNKQILEITKFEHFKSEVDKGKPGSYRSL